ncbi:hypothetical protein A9P82_08040 [Arachidicoccus ginsenosidimutans]|nr:hypothetical protein A9P82_08040 [Arachidicoccus sp. BS20]
MERENRYQSVVNQKINFLKRNEKLKNGTKTERWRAQTGTERQMLFKCFTIKELAFSGGTKTERPERF